MAISLTLYLDIRAAKRNAAVAASTSENCGKVSEFPVKIAITKQSATAYLPTGIKIAPQHWKNRRVIGRKDKGRLNDFLDSFKSRVRNLILEGVEDGSYLDKTATEIKNDIAVKMHHGCPRTKSTPFFTVYDKFAESREKERTKEIYRVTGRKIRQLIPGSEKLTLEAIDLDWLENLDETLERKGNNPTTRNIDFRNIRAVLKYAQKHKIIQDNPFDEFDIPQGGSPNRALTVEQLRTLIHAETLPWEEKYRDFFILSFLLMGMNTEDLVHAEQIVDGRLDYVRSKTGAPISVRVCEKAQALFKKYKGGRYLLNVLDSYSRTHNWTAKVDAALRGIAERNHLPPITMYWARHTWATLASADLGIDLSTISDALGHQPEKKVTLLYIRRKDYSKVDEANQRVIDYVFSQTNDGLSSGV